jgi:transmembrane sensor
MDKDKVIAFLNNDDKGFDKKEVEQWIEKNKDEFEKIKYVWGKAGISRKEEPDTERAWMRVYQEIQKNHGNKKKKIKILATNFQRIAAILVIAFAIGFIAYQQYTPNKIETAWLEVKNNTDSIRKVELDDGTVLWLNGNSEIKYQKGYGTKKREVYLEGEAFFEVVHNTKKPFIVYTENSITKDLGTSFNIKTDLSGGVQVAVVSGSVSLSGIAHKNKKVVLKKGEMGLLSAQDQRLEKQLNENLNFLAWKTGRLSFNKTPLEEVCETLTKYYKTKIYLKNEELKQINLTANYDNKKLDEVLEIMKLTLDIQYQHSDTTVVLTSGK